MENKKPDLLVDVIHPFVRDLTEVLSKHYDAVLDHENKSLAIETVMELLDVIVNHYKEDLKNITYGQTYSYAKWALVDPDVIQTLVKINLKAIRYEMDKRK
ncbi:hypothetical protein [Persephonella sp.]|uniref:hypothetical protein n=1 Tax=Persephonella sp. TaxID=2060922 RepID=UPI00262D5921|nr:hypothetical protein [Persephonella sp.]